MNKNFSTSLKNIFVFLDLLKKINQKEIQYLKQQYLQSAERFEDCLEFLLSAKLVKLNSGYVEPTPLLNKFLLERPNEKQTREFLVNNLFSSKNTYLLEYLKRFSATEDKYIFTPQISESLQFSSLRNLLIELEFISYNSINKNYEINDGYLPLFLEFIKLHSISPEKLKSIIEEQDRIGKYAELEIMNYEKSRLLSQKSLLSEIEHVSLIDATMGYDIKSFTVNDNMSVSERFIEVKAISNLEKKFFMTRNEIEISRKYSQSYYLYLLPVLGKYKFDIAKLIIIHDPYNNVIKSNDWVVECEQIVVKKKESE